MSVLEGYFRQKADETYDHPLLRIVDEAAKHSEVKRVAVEVLRPRDALGFKSPKLYLHLLGEAGQEVQHDQKKDWDDWDDALNTALVKRRIRAVSADNEKVRFALGLRAALQAPETRFGDGYYNAVLVHHIVNSPFARHPAVESVLMHVYRNSIDPSFRTYAECRGLIDTAFRGRAMELVENLGYDIPEAEEILAAAVAQYLDERFSVTNRRIMGLL
jgi:hypothetical protein